MGEKEDVEISKQVEQLRGFSRQQLLDLWRKAFQHEPPVGIRRELLVQFLAYRIQENAFGGLTAAARSELSRISRAFDSGAAAGIRARLKLKPGTRLLRTWRGETHEIISTDSGYEYRDVRYESLSVIARKITGTHWSGPAFFGLNKSKNSLAGNDV